MIWVCEVYRSAGIGPRSKSDFGLLIHIRSCYSIPMKNHLNALLFLFLFGLGIGCSSKLVVETEPSDAQISIAVHGSDRKVEFGQTPIEVTESDIRSKVGVSLGKISLVEVHLEKSGYKKEKILITSGQWGSLASRMKVKMKAAKKETEHIDELLQHMMNAQKFTHSRQFSRAHDEIDKALSMSPKFGRAMAMKGAIFYLQRLYVDSEQWYEKSLGEDPALTDSIKMLDIIRRKKSITQ